MTRWLVSGLIATLIMLLVVGSMEAAELIMIAFWWCLIHHPVLYCGAVITIFGIITIFIYHIFTDDDEEENGT